MGQLIRRSGKKARAEAGDIAKKSVVEVAEAGGKVFFGLSGQEQRQAAAWLEGSEGVAGEVMEEGNPFRQRGAGDTVGGVLAGEHGVIGWVAEDEVAAGCFGGKAMADVVEADIGTGWMEVISQATATHRLADVERGSTAGHRVNDQGTGKRVVVECVCNDGRRDGRRDGGCQRRGRAGTTRHHKALGGNRR